MEYPYWTETRRCATCNTTMTDNDIDASQCNDCFFDNHVPCEDCGNPIIASDAAYHDGWALCPACESAYQAELTLPRSPLTRIVAYLRAVYARHGRKAS